MLIHLIIACVSSPTGPSLAINCHSSEHPIEADDDILGFLSADVLEVMQADLPTGMSLTMDELGIGPGLSVEVHGIGGMASVVEYTNEEPGCEDLPARALAVPVEFTVELADGQLSASFTQEVRAASLDVDEIVPMSAGEAWRMTVGPEANSKITAWAEAEYGGVGTDPKTMLWFGGGDGSSWAANRMILDIWGADPAGEVGQPAWEGVWTLD